MATKQPIKKRAYKKRVKKGEAIFVDTTGEYTIPVVQLRDELDLLRDMLTAFESMTDEARGRAYDFFTNKYSRYGLSKY